MGTYVTIKSPEIYTTISRLVDDVINHVLRNIVIYQLYNYWPRAVFCHIVS